MNLLTLNRSPSIDSIGSLTHMNSPTCIGCGLPAKPYMNHDAVGQFWRCSCGLIFQDPREFVSEQAGLQAIMNAGEDTSAEVFQKAFSESIDTSDSNGNMYADHGIDHQRMAVGICDATLKIFESHGGNFSQPFRILDVGCANGFLLGEIKKRFSHADVVGIEPSPVSAQKAKRLFGLDIHVGTTNSFGSDGPQFDFVTILGNLQLHENPFQTLLHCYQLLRPGGLLICQFKNPYCSARVLGRWASKVPFMRKSSVTRQIFERGFACMRHSGSKHALRQAIERTGLVVIDTKTIAPRMLAWTDGNTAHAAGIKGKIWAVLDRVDQLTDQRAWIEFVCQKPGQRPR